jgi:hypothetical protein
MYHDDHDDFDEHGLPKDRRRFSASPSTRVDTRDSTSDSRNRITLHDGHGNPIGRRPSFVVSDAVPQEALDAIRDAYAEYLDYIQNAWRGSNKN